MRTFSQIVEAIVGSLDGAPSDEQIRQRVEEILREEGIVHWTKPAMVDPFVRQARQRLSERQ